MSVCPCPRNLSLFFIQSPNLKQGLGVFLYGCWTFTLFLFSNIQLSPKLIAHKLFDMSTVPNFPMHLSPQEARNAFQQLLPTRSTQQKPLKEALGCTLAQDLQAKVSHPSATESALDGIACREADTLAATAQAPVSLRLVGESRAGAPFSGEVAQGECIRIYTGAPLAKGTDAICPVEQLKEVEGDEVQLLRPAKKKDVRHKGDDFSEGETVLQAGLPLTASRLALATALGYAQIPVLTPLRVALLSTGDEVIEPGQPLQAGQVYDSNSVGLSAMLQECGCEVLPLGRAPDSIEALQYQMDQAGGADLLLTSGGVSMGKYDFMRDLLIEHGEVAFWKIRMRPGGPVLLGRWNKMPVFGLPGNPVSSLVVFQLIVRPVLTNQGPLTLQCQSVSAFKSVPNKTVFARATVEGRQVSAYFKQGSGILRSLSESNALVVVPEGQDVQVGDWVDVIL